MHSNLTEDLDPSTADAVVDAYGASPLNRTRSPKEGQFRDARSSEKACKNAVADLISSDSSRRASRRSAGRRSRRRCRRSTRGVSMWSVVDAFQAVWKSNSGAPRHRRDVDSLVDFHTGSRATRCWLVEQSSTPSSSRLEGFRAASTSPILRQVVSKMLASYQDVPYHNCLHGADVLQAMHALLNLAPTFDDALG